MKKNNYFIFAWTFFLICIFGCNSGTKKQINNQTYERKNETQYTKKQPLLKNDSFIQKEKPTYQQLYSESERRLEATGSLKHDLATKNKTYNYLQSNDSVKITLFYIGKRIVTVEKRIFKGNIEKGFNIYDFDENNNMFSESKWNNVEKMTFTNAIYWGTLLRFDVRCNVVDLDLSQKQEIVKAAKASLDSIMQFFPEFKYTFDWETKINNPMAAEDQSSSKTWLLAYTFRIPNTVKNCSVFVKPVEGTIEEIFSSLRITDGSDTLYSVENTIFSNKNGIDIRVHQEGFYGYRFVVKNKDGFILTALGDSGKSVSDDIWIKWNNPKNIFEVQKTP
jgi:hypothetical protein